MKPFPQGIDFDKLATIALKEVTAALRGWLKGRPTDEVALLNRITEKLDRNRRGCDIGVAERVKLVSQLAMLHRQGKNQTDLFGSDLAVTIVADDLSFFKTVLLQFKKGSGFQPRLEKSQLQQAMTLPITRDRSFVMYADEGRTGIRFREVPPLHADFDQSQSTKQFDAAEWIGFTRWLWNWMVCSIGPESDEDDPRAIEALLQNYVTEEDWVSPWIEESDATFDDDILPASAWLVLFLVRENADTELAAKLK